MKNLPAPITQDLLERFVRGGLNATENELVMQMAMQFPEVAGAIDLAKRGLVDQIIAAAKQQDPHVFVESGALEAYLQGGANASEQQSVELMAFLHPVVAEELNDLELLNAELVNRTSSQVPRIAAKKSFMDFVDDDLVKAGNDRIIRPPFLNSKSKAADFQFWLDAVGPVNPADAEELLVKPLVVDPECITMLVSVKSQIEGETHLDSIEKFLVLEGACTINMDGEEFHLKTGDYMSIPKFKHHTVKVTSEMRCKLIVQQIAA